MTDFTKPLFIGAVGLSAFTSGGISALSLMTIPGILAAYAHPATVSPIKTPLSDPSPLLLSQWARVYALGSKLMPAAAAASALCNLGLAYLHYAPTATAVGNALGGPWGTRRSTIFAAAAGVTVAIAPWTFLAMKPTNDELHARDDEGRGAVVNKENRKGGSTKELLEWWGVLNLLRAVFPAVGTLLAFQALSV